MVAGRRLSFLTLTRALDRNGDQVGGEEVGATSLRAHGLSSYQGRAGGGW